MGELQTMCHILDGEKLLLKMANRGVSKGKWNAPGGKINDGETPEECAIREVYEETGLRIRDLFSHGVMNFHLGGGDETTIIVHLFSTREFDGTPKSSEEGEVQWFDSGGLPYDDMWDDDNYWIGLMLKKKRFNADFYFDKSSKYVTKYTINLI